MCQAYPGLRCAGHTKQRLVSLDKKLQKTNAELDTLESSLRTYETKSMTVPETVIERYRTVSKQQDEIKAKIRHTRREYDATKTGIAKLEARLEASSDPRERKRIQSRLTAANMLRGWSAAGNERVKQGSFGKKPSARPRTDAAA